MILLTNDIDIEKIKIKNKLKYSDNNYFIPIKYNKTDLTIQTPKLYNYGINKKFNKEYINLSFKNIKDSLELKEFYKILNKIYDKINNKYKGNNFIKECNKEKYIRLKINKNTIFFDNRKNKIDNIIKNTYGNYIIYLYGLWIKDDIISYQWYLLQAKIDIPLYLEKYSFIDNKKIPPPPPLPPKFISKPYKLNIKNKKEPLKKKNNHVAPTVEELQNILNKFKKKSII